MDNVYDLSKITRALKSDENVIAFTSFSIDQMNQPRREGVLKKSSFFRPYWSGYLTMTFIMDTDDDMQVQESLSRHFADINEHTLRPHFKGQFDTVFRCPMDAMSKSAAWYFEEINVYFKSIKGRERGVIEQQLIPALEKLLPIHFGPLEWWDQQAPKIKIPQAPVGKNKVEAESLMSAVMKWFRTI
jgi:hypothetical protein